MNDLNIAATENGIGLKDFPDGAYVVALSGHKAQRLSDLALHKEDLKFSLEAITTIANNSNLSAFLKEALWRIAIVHYMKCFGESARFQISENKVYKNDPPEALAAFKYFKSLRNKHFIHDESSLAQSNPGAVINKGDKPHKVEGIICISFYAETLEHENISNLYNLTTHAMKWVAAEFDKIQKDLKSEIENLSYEQAISLPKLQIKTPDVKESNKKRSGHI